MTAVAILRRDDILVAMASGKRLTELDMGVSAQAISRALKDDPEYHEAIESGFRARLDQAEKATEDAKDSVDVSRARARFQNIGWRAEREFWQVWGQKSQVTVLKGPSLDQQLDSLAASLLDKMRVVSIQEQAPDMLSEDHSK